MRCGAQSLTRCGARQRGIREDQVVVDLMSVDFLRVGPHHDPSMKDAARAAVQNALVDFAASRVRPGMVDARVRVEQSVAVGDVQAVKAALAALAVESNRDVAPRETRAERVR
jgi:7-keto-8-aminopelargonate synthetase-like enzyme